MTKKEASEVLGKSVRTVAEYVATGRLKQSYVDGKNGKQAIFDEDEVRRLKEELETPVQRAVVVDTSAATINSRDLIQQLLTSQADSQQRIAAILEALSAPKQIQPPSAVAPTELSLTELNVKRTVKLSEAQRISGLSRSRLIEAIRTGKLKADSKKFGRGWGMKLTDLDAFIKSM